MIDFCIPNMQHKIKYLVKSLGISMVFLFLALVQMISYSYIYDNCLIIHYYFRNIYLTSTFIIGGMYMIFSIVFNFCMTCLISSGTVKEMLEKKNPFIEEP